MGPKSKHKVIGEGTYGCVIEPALKCTTEQDYDNKVSKVMKYSDAVKELREYDSLKSIPDIEKYAVRVPVLCDPKLGVDFSTVVRKCKGSRVRGTYKENQRRLAILLMENGGLDLNNFSINIFPELETDDQNKFLTAFLDVIKGVQFFNKMDILHQDIKAGNMVYSLKTNKMKFIDFGLMTTKTQFIKSSSRNENRFAQTWSYYPPEFSCANFSDFDDLDKCMQYRNDYSEKNEPDHDAFIKDMADTFDSYCLTLALSKLMERYLPIGYNNPTPFFKEATSLFKKYCEDNLLDRYDDLNELIINYRNLLKKHGLYNKNTPTPSVSILEEAEKLSLKSDIFLSPTRIQCPKNKPDYNPKTMKCVAACKEGKIRNQNFRCVKLKTVKKTKSKNNRLNNKTRKTTMPKEKMCESMNKDYNPITNRCIKKCKPNQRRSAKNMKCVSNKQVSK